MISETSKKFIISILLFSSILAIAGAGLYLTILKSYYPKAFPLQFIIILIITIFSHLRLIKACERNIRQFTTQFMASVTIKLMIYLSFLLIYLLIDSTGAISFVLTFFVLYVCFTVFEIQNLLKYLDKLKNNQKNN